MTLASGTTRADIAAALATVPGVAASPTRPPNVQPGCAWPQFLSGRPQTMGCEVYDCTWFIWVALAPDHAAAIEAGDMLARQIGAVLNRIGAHSIYETHTLVGDDGNGIPALRYEFHSN